MMHGHKKKGRSNVATALHNKLIFSLLLNLTCLNYFPLFPTLTVVSYSQLSGVIRAHSQIPDEEIVFEYKPVIANSGSAA